MAASLMKTEASVGLYASAGPSTSRGARNFSTERSTGMRLSLGPAIESSNRRPDVSPVTPMTAGAEPQGAELNQRRAPSSALSACSTARI
jgi:hypothetical protein